MNEVWYHLIQYLRDEQDLISTSFVNLQDRRLGEIGNMAVGEFIFHRTEDGSYVRKLFGCETIMAHMACVFSMNSQEAINNSFFQGVSRRLFSYYRHRIHYFATWVVKGYSPR